MTTSSTHPTNRPPIDAHDRLTIVTHEMNNELQIAQARVDLLMLDPQVGARVTELRGDLQRLRSLVRDYLTYGELQRRPLCLNIEATSLSALLGSLQESAALSLGDTPTVLGARNVRVLADERRLHQALWNVVRNAYRHGKAPVTIAVATTPDTAIISVGDCGAGFSEPADRARFGWTSEEGGSGVGLWLTTAIIEAHSGHIWRGRSDCGGAHVGVSLPLAPNVAEVDGTSA